MIQRESRPRFHGRVEPTAKAPPPAAPASRRERLVLWAMIAAYAATHSVIGYVKYRHYLFLDSDLAIFSQAVGRLLRGSLFNSIRGMNWLGDHVSLILVPIAPIYAVFQHPLTLLVLQSVLLGLGALPVHALARRQFGAGPAAPAFAALYLLHPAVSYSNLYEFHPEVLATSLLLAMFAFMAAGRAPLAFLFAGLVMLCKEDVALLVLMAGLWALLPGQALARRHAFTLVGMAGVYLLLSFGIIRPAAGGGEAEYGVMYRRWGGSWSGVALNLLRDPLAAISAFVATPGEPYDTMLKRQYWLLMLAPVLFLPLAGPLTLAVALPILAEHFLSFRPNQHRIVFHYTALVVPVLMVASVRGLANLLRVLPGRGGAVPGGDPDRLRRARAGTIAAIAVAASLVCNLVYGPLLRRDWTLVQQGVSESVWPTDHDRALRPYRDRMLRRVRAAGGVVASAEFLAGLSPGQDVHSLHHVVSGYYTFSSKPYPLPTGIEALVADLSNPLLREYLRPDSPARLRDLVAVNHLRPAAAAGNNLLLLKGVADTVELVRAGVPPPEGARRVVYDGQLAFEGCTLGDSSCTAGGILPVETFWRATAAVDRHFVVQLLVRHPVGGGFTLDRALGHLLYPPATWPRDTTVRETYRLVIPLDSPPGRYTLQMRLGASRGNRQFVSTPDDPRVARSHYLVDLGSFTVAAGARGADGPTGTGR